MIDWWKTTLGDVVEFTNGGAWNQSEYTETGIPVVRVSDIQNGTVNLDDCKFLSEESITKYRKHLLNAGDVVIATVGSHPTQPASVVGRVAKIPLNAENTLLNQNAVRLKPSVTKLDRGYLLYLALSPAFRGYIIAHARGSANQVRVAIAALRDMPLTLPPPNVQTQVASILSAYDDLIENNTRRIKILEEIAQMIYREWFVNYRFPGHEKIKWADSPLGPIPHGWMGRKLGELLSVDKGVSYNGAGLTEEGNPMVNLKNIQPGGGFRRDATKPYSGDFKSRHTVKPGDVVVANTDLTQAGNIVATPVLIPRIGNGHPILISHHLFAIRCSLGISPLFFYHLMLQEDFRGFAKGFAIGTTVLGLPKEGILDFAFACPPEPLIRDFIAGVSPLHELIEILFEQNENLLCTRNLLLPKLISGGINLEHLETETASQIS